MVVLTTSFDGGGNDADDEASLLAKGLCFLCEPQEFWIIDERLLFAVVRAPRSE